MSEEHQISQQGEISVFTAEALPFWRIYPVLGLGLGVLLIVLLTPSPNTTPEQGVKMLLPGGLGSYEGRPIEVTRAELNLLPDDTEFERKLYHSAYGDQILCSIVLAGGAKRSIHRPETCLPGQGWTIRSSRSLEVALHNGKTLTVTDLSLSREEKFSDTRSITIRQHYLYWFVGQNIVTHSHYERVFLSSWGRLWRNLNHRWAYVTVSARVTDNLKRYGGRNSEETVVMLKEFIADVEPFIHDLDE